jgi:hypothetical protein
MRHGAVTFGVTLLLLAGIGTLVYKKNREVNEAARAALLSDPMYADSPAAALVQESLVEQDRQALYSTIGLLGLLAVWIALATMISTREVAAQLRRLRQALREIGAQGRAHDPALEEEKGDVASLLASLHAEVKEASQWAPTASMVFRVETAGKPRVQTGFVWRWAFFAFFVFVASQILPIWVWKLHGWRDVGVAAGAWLVGGFLVALLSPGRTILEPAVGALFAAQATLFYLLLDFDPDLHGGKVTEYLLGAVAGFLLALAGATAGEWLGGRFRKKV